MSGTADSDLAAEAAAAQRRSNPAMAGFRRILPINGIVTVVISGTTASLLFAQLPAAWVWGWLGLHVGTAAYVFGRGLLPPARRDRTRQTFLRIVDSAVAGLSGLIWGLGAVFLPYLDQNHQVLLIMVTGGMVAGSSATLAVVPSNAVAYMLSAALPYIVAFILAGGTLGYALAAMATTFTVAMLVTNRIIYGVIRRNRRLHDENLALYGRIRAAQDELLDIAESSEAFAFFGEDGRLLLWNQRFPALLGLDMGALQRDAPLAPLLLQAGLPADLTDRLEAAVAGAPRPVLELAHRRWVRASLRRTAQGDRALVLVDVTEQQSASARLQDQNERLAELFRQVSEARDAALRASQAKSTFLANMSHELRTPLNAIIGFSDIMQQKLFGPASPRYDEYLHDIHSSALHLLGIINDILDLARIEANQIVLNEEPVCIAEEAATCIRLADQQDARGGQVVLTDLPDSLPDLLADARLVRQILINLLGNALKFSPPGAPIEIGGRCNGAGEIEIWVRDRGIGIAAADQARIFEPFEQADSQLSRKFGGVGLGLSLVRAFVAAHQGRVAIDSQPGRGTRISAIFPASRTVTAGTAGMPAG